MSVTTYRTVDETWPADLYQPNDETWPAYVDRVLTTTLPYETRLEHYTSFRAEEWCRSTFGPRWSIGFTAGAWACRVNHVSGRHRFSFAKEEHLMWFRMRWA
jgi:hypothetical protein